MEPRRRFRFLKELSEGAFGKVYLAEMVTGDNFKSVVAIKLLHGKWQGHEEIVQRSRDEARVLGLLHHRNIIRVEDLTSIGGQVAIVMEYLNGVDLKTLVNHVRDRGGRVPRKIALEIGAQVASALEAAYYHRPLQGGDPLLLIHRDIKPSNVMLTVAGEVKVLDFGTAQARFDDREAHTQALAFGSAAYMAPERLLGDPDAPSGDVFSLGITLYELLAGDAYGKIHIRPEKYEAKLDRRVDAIDLSDLDPDQADKVRMALRVLLAYDAGDRPTATQVVEILEALADEIHDGSMRRFCREQVAPIRELIEPEADPEDPLTGSTLFEDVSGLLDRMEEEAEESASLGRDASATWIDEPDDPGEGRGAAVSAPDLRMPPRSSLAPANVYDPGGTVIPDADGISVQPVPPGQLDQSLFTAPTMQHNEAAFPDAGSGAGQKVVMGDIGDPSALDAETVRMSPEEARRMVEEEARAQRAVEAALKKAKAGRAAPADQPAPSASPAASAASSRTAAPAPQPAPSPGPARTSPRQQAVAGTGGGSATVTAMPGRQPVAAAGGANKTSSGVALQSARREEPARSGGGVMKAVIGLVVLLILGGGAVGGLIATGVIDLGGGGTAPDPVAKATPPGPAASDMQGGGTVQVADPGPGKGTATLTLKPPGAATVNLRESIGDYEIDWDGTGKLELVGLPAGTYKTKVKPKAGGSAARATLDVQDGKSCSFVFDLKAEEWSQTGCE
jgi:serine/threonine protein kinase